MSVAQLSQTKKSECGIAEPSFCIDGDNVPNDRHQWWAFCSEKGRGQIVRGLESEFQTHEVGIVPNFWLFRPSEI